MLKSRIRVPANLTCPRVFARLLLLLLEQAGVVKMNVDTDTQWTYWQGVKDFYQVRIWRPPLLSVSPARLIYMYISPVSFDTLAPSSKSEAPIFQSRY